MRHSEVPAANHVHLQEKLPCPLRLVLGRASASVSLWICDCIFNKCDREEHNGIHR